MNDYPTMESALHAAGVLTFPAYAGDVSVHVDFGLTLTVEIVGCGGARLITMESLARLLTDATLETETVYGDGVEYGRVSVVGSFPGVRQVIFTTVLDCEPEPDGVHLAPLRALCAGRVDA